MKHNLLFLLLFSLLSCSPESTEMAFDLKERIYIPVSINGKEYKFLFDTGAGMTRLSETLAKELNVTATDSIPITIVSEKMVKNCPIYEEISFGIGGLPVKSRFCTNTNKTVNLIGMDIISQFHWQFNFRTSRLSVSKKEIPMNCEDSVRMVFQYKEPVMTIPMTIEDSIHKFYFDTGLAKGGINEEFMLFVDESPDALMTRLREKNGGGAAYYSDRYQILILISFLVNDHRLPYFSFLFDIHPENRIGEQNFLCVGMKFISGRYRILNINPEKQIVTLAKREGECVEYEKKQKDKFDEMVKRYEVEQKEQNDRNRKEAGR